MQWFALVFTLHCITFTISHLGDAGHGLIMLVFGLFMVFKEDSLAKKAGSNEIFNIFFGGRYIVTMMGFFSIYTGLIYNDVFSKSLNIFGSHWAYPNNSTFPLKLDETLMLDPGNFTQYKGDPYVFGIDPGWQYATNKITFLNGYKMKISLIFGLIHMVFGVCLSAWNKILKRKYAEIFLEFLPQLIFLVFIFCYLIFLIFFKWVHYYADTAHKDTNDHSEHCAPNLLITFINMMLFKNNDPDEKLKAICHGYETYMFGGQKQLQTFLVLMGVLMIPIMLLGKPLHQLISQRRGNGRRQLRQNTDGESLLGETHQTEIEDDLDNQADHAHQVTNIVVFGEWFVQMKRGTSSSHFKNGESTLFFLHTENILHMSVHLTRRKLLRKSHK